MAYLDQFLRVIVADPDAAASKGLTADFADLNG
jgi:hypothetical protein